VGIYTVSGRLLRVLRDKESLVYGFQNVHWDGRDGEDNDTSSGIYICRVTAKNDVREIIKLSKMVRMK